MFHGGYCYESWVTALYDSLEVWTMSMKYGMLCEGLLVERKRRASGIDDVPLHVNFQERRSRDLMVEQSEWIDEEMLLILSDPHSQMREVVSRPSVSVQEPTQRAHLASENSFLLRVPQTIHSSDVIYWQQGSPLLL